MNIPLARPDITEREIEAVVAVLRTPQLALGPKLKEFEDAIAEYSGVRYAVAVNSGTSALHLIIRALGIGAGDEVITTPFSFISSSNCILFERAKPVFVDIDSRTLNLAPERIEEAVTPCTKAILAVDVFGHPADWPVLERVAQKRNLLLIEDSAEALGSEYSSPESEVQSPGSESQDNAARSGWKKAGSFGNAGVFAFYPNKQITTGEGGMVLTDDEEIARLCRSLRNQGRGEGDEWLAHERLGYNYRISDINCALGIAQLARINEILEKREQVAQMYNERLKGIDGVAIPYVSPDVKIGWFVYVIRLSDQYTREDRDQILQKLKQRGIGCGNYFQPIHLQPFYRKMFGYKEGDFPITEHIASRTIALPFYNKLTEGEVDYVVESLAEIVRRSKVQGPKSKV
ncbi:DegT/DnrJ/EryC1/StrS family aminotransferase [Candidatus Bipolaricaulota bacterium]|nr:DegT/DnrJ/EryC1/StrS family aminotransferase [Candidatus Bipolaricaulota bacterium]